MADHDTVHVRKYPNRRYYDTTRSRHVTLADLHEIVRDGGQIVVTDSATGADITSTVLMQIMLEHAAERLDLLPARLLHQMIQANEQMLARFVREYFDKAVDAFAQSREQFDAFLARAGLSPLASGTPFDWAQQLMRSFVSASPWTPPPPSTVASSEAAESPPNQGETLSDMQERINQLSAELIELRRAQTSTRKTGGTKKAKTTSASTRRSRSSAKRPRTTPKRRKRKS